MCSIAYIHDRIISWAREAVCPGAPQCGSCFQIRRRVKAEILTVCKVRIRD
jgi:hypothetical protein